jgi:hypothetical protein
MFGIFIKIKLPDYEKTINNHSFIVAAERTKWQCSGFLD